MIIKRNVELFLCNWRKSLYFSIATRTFVNKADIKVNITNENTTETLVLDWKNALPYEKIPGPTAFSLVAGFLPGGKFYKVTRAKLMKSMFDEYGEIFKIIGLFGRRDMIVIQNPKNFEKVFRTEGVNPYRLALATLDHYRTEINPKPFMNVGGLLSQQDEEWAKFRSIVNPILMQPRTVKIYIPKMDQVAIEFISKIREIRDPKTNEVPGTFKNIINLWTLESVSLVALDTHLGLLTDNNENPDAKKLINAIAKLFILTVDLDMNPSIWKWIRTPKYYQLMKAYDDLTEITGKYVNESLKRIENEDTNEINENEKSILQRIVKHDKRIAVVMAMDLLMAGVDTTTTAFTSSLLAIAKNPEKQKKLREEIMKILPTKDTPLTSENMKNLPYLRACIKEALRMYPVIPNNMRGSGQNLTLSGYQIPKGTHILMAAEFEDTEYDFDKPKEFIPERWLRAEHIKQNECPITSKPINPFSYLPFGFGARSCIGKRIVEMEMETAIVKIIRNFNVEFNYPDDVFTLQLIFTPDRELKFKFTDIDN